MQSCAGEDEPAAAACCIFSPDSKTLWVGYEDGTVRVFDVKTLQLTESIDLPDAGSCTSIAASSDGSTLAFGWADQAISQASSAAIHFGLYIWDARVPKPEFGLRADIKLDAWPWSIAFATGNRLCVGLDDGTVEVSTFASRLWLIAVCRGDLLITVTAPRSSVLVFLRSLQNRDGRITAC